MERKIYRSRTARRAEPEEGLLLNGLFEEGHGRGCPSLSPGSAQAGCPGAVKWDSPRPGSSLRFGRDDNVGRCQPPGSRTTKVGDRTPCHPGSAAGAIRDGLDAGAGREHLLGRGRAEAVAGAEEEEVGQGLVIPAEAKRRAGTGRDTSILPDSPLGLSRETADRSAGVEIILSCRSRARTIRKQRKTRSVLVLQPKAEYYRASSKDCSAACSSASVAPGSAVSASRAA